MTETEQGLRDDLEATKDLLAQIEAKWRACLDAHDALAEQLSAALDENRSLLRMLEGAAEVAKREQRTGNEVRAELGAVYRTAGGSRPLWRRWDQIR